MTQDRTKTLENAQKYAAKGLYDRAIAEFKKVLETNPKDIRTLLKIGDLYTRKGDRDEAIESYHHVAQHYAQQGFFLKAVAVYKQILKLDARRIDVAMRLAEMYKQLALVNDALQTYEDIAAQHIEAGNHPQAMATFALMVDLDPTNVPVRIKYAESLSQAGSILAAAEQFEAGAQLLKEQNRTDDYIKVCERLLFHRSDDTALAHEIASLYLRKNEPKAALSKLQLCFSRNPNDPETLSLLAAAFQAIGQEEKAISVYRELANVYQHKNKLKERADVLGKILALDPHDENAQQALAGYAPSGLSPRFPSYAPRTAEQPVDLDAIDDDEVELLEEDETFDGPPSDIFAHPAMAAAGISPAIAKEAQIARLMTECGVYENYGLKAEVTKQLLRVLEIAPSHMEAREKLKEIYLEAGNIDEAITQLDHLAKACEATDPARAQIYREEAASLSPRGDASAPPQPISGRLMQEEHTDVTAHDGALAHIRKELSATRRNLASLPLPHAERAVSSAAAPAYAPPGRPLIEDSRLRPLTPMEFEALPVAQSVPPRAVSIGNSGSLRVEQALDEAEFYLVQGLYEETLQALQDLLNAYPKNRLVLSRLEEAKALAASIEDSSPLIVVDSTDQTAALTEQLAEEVFPEETDSGMQALEVNNALRQIRRGIQEQLSAEDTDTHFDLGIAYKEMALYDDAIEEFKICMKNPARECNASTMIGICFKEKGQLTEAIKNFKRGLHAEQKTKEEELGLFYELGLAYEALGDSGEAVYYFSEVIKRQRDFRNAARKIEELEGKSPL
ncbi:MAG: tetratricopeptide repeat protein [Myxococcales bacterium]|nr:tetratricopeptide repeat protein [Myxococcales bacterium]